MAAALQPGQWITVKIKSAPRSEGGRKTLNRLLERDPKVKQERVRTARSRPVGGHSRGGRIWEDRPARLTLVKLTPGATYRVFASLDVLRDLKCVDKYIELTPAK